MTDKQPSLPSTGKSREWYIYPRSSSKSKWSVSETKCGYDSILVREVLPGISQPADLFIQLTGFHDGDGNSEAVIYSKPGKARMHVREVLNVSLPSDEVMEKAERFADDDYCGYGDDDREAAIECFLAGYAACASHQQAQSTDALNSTEKTNASAGYVNKAQAKESVPEFDNKTAIKRFNKYEKGLFCVDSYLRGAREEHEQAAKVIAEKDAEIASQRKHWEKMFDEAGIEYQRVQMKFTNFVKMAEQDRLKNEAEIARLTDENERLQSALSKADPALYSERYEKSQHYIDVLDKLRAKEVEVERLTEQLVDLQRRAELLFDACKRKMASDVACGHPFNEDMGKAIAEWEGGRE